MVPQDVSQRESITGSAPVDNFSLVQGGPISRLRPISPLRPSGRALVAKRALAAVLFTWLPLLFLAALQNRAFSDVTIPLLRDYATNVRYLIALPILIVAEMTVDPRIRQAVKHFVGSGLVDCVELPAFEDVILKGNRLRDSWWPTAILILLAFIPSFLFKGKELLASATSSWHVIRTTSGETLSLAGWWFATVSVPIYRFLMYRWIWIILMWAIFLRRVSSLRLNCVATHPDRAAGLGFLVETQRAFRSVAFAASAVVAGGLANQIIYQGKSLADLKFLIGVSMALILGVTFAPLLVLAPALHEYKRRALLNYGTLGVTYVRDFDLKWIRGRVGTPEILLGTGDIQSLADLSNCFSVVKDMKYILVQKEFLKGLGLPILIPMAVLALSVSPADQIIKAILRLLG